MTQDHTLVLKAITVVATEGGNQSPGDVAADSLPMIPWMVPHPCEYGCHYLDLGY